jgi:hypothetical protein
MLSLEQYADLCVWMTDTDGDEIKEIAVAAARGVAGPSWLEAKAYYTAKMMDANDMGRTAMAFTPLYQQAADRLRDDDAPCSLELYTRIHAEMSYRADVGRLLAEHGYTRQSWLSCQIYWSPRVASNIDPKFDIAAAMKFRQLMQQELDRIGPNGRKQP